MRQRKLGSHTPPCHRRMVITTLFSVLLAALQRRPVLYHTRWLLTVHWHWSSGHLGQLAPTTHPQCRLVSNPCPRQGGGGGVLSHCGCHPPPKPQFSRKTSDGIVVTRCVTKRTSCLTKMRKLEAHLFFFVQVGVVQSALMGLYPPPPCISYANVRNYYGPYAHCSLDKGVACAQYIQLPAHTCACTWYECTLTSAHISKCIQTQESLGNMKISGSHPCWHKQ